ncbi:hypothetical protein CR513_58953, partial [Mucuna pruriens]
MKQEIDVLKRNDTWPLAPYHMEIRLLEASGYKIKYNSDGSVEPYKARLKEGINYNETFALVSKMIIVWTLLVVVTTQSWILHQMDVHNASLHDDLDREYANSRISLWITTSTTKLVYKAYCHIKSIWSHANYSFFTYHSDEVILTVIVCVDDLIIAGNKKMWLRASKGVLALYTLDIISKTRLLDVELVGFHFQQMTLPNGIILEDPECYHRLVGRLIYLTISRLEVSYSVHILAQFMQCPQQEHWEAATQVVRYLKGNLGQRIFICFDNEFTLYEYRDSDCLSHPQPMQLYYDSQAAMYVVVNLMFHECTKHIEVDCHYIHDEIHDGNIVTVQVRTFNHLVDILTKALGKHQYNFLLGKLGIITL